MGWITTFYGIDCVVDKSRKVVVKHFEKHWNVHGFNCVFMISWASNDSIFLRRLPMKCYATFNYLLVMEYSMSHNEKQA
ncbi:CLUMA_CG021510, isoform A [Clunio marinus]|uniref:CLUMA_CG021510, isoform A n=1 Tax=Clunio marinus TaxID=568069 RepID=A0A1J1JAS7_9DIPT|nr:CLUMA_CG021510, isoform A [Clunio marinus]